MAQPPLQLIIGNYNTSSWSLRAWLTLRAARLAFVETRIPLRLPETPERIGRYSPSGKLPVLLAEGVPIWDSLAIAEFVAELEPDIWPLDPIARAEARSISAELHSGFAELSRLMPMDVVGRFNAPGRLPRGLAADVQRIATICAHCRARFATQGPFLFGAFTIADAMMAPIASRLSTHGVPLDGAVEDYVDSLLAWPDMVTWCEAAAAEQAERRTAGSLAVASVTRPGRVLGPEPATEVAAPETEARTTEPETTKLETTKLETTGLETTGSETTGSETTGADSVEPATAEAAPSVDSAPAAPENTPAPAIIEPQRPPAAAPVAPAPETPEPVAAAKDGALGAGEPGAGSAAAGAPKTDEPPASEPPAGAARPREQEPPQPATEPWPAEADAAPSPVPNPLLSAPRRRLFEPSPPAGSETTDQQPAPARSGDGAASPARAESETPPARKLGWLRHRVPADHLGSIDQPPYDGEVRDRADREETPAAHRTTPASETDAADAPAPGRRPAASPGAPAIKPIGGGIHRRR